MRFLIIIVVATLVRILYLGHESLWVDEAFSWRWANLSHRELWGTAAKFEYNPPLYFSLQRIWLVFGPSESALRSLSVILGILTCVAVYVLGRMLDGPRTGEYAAALAATQPVLVAYSQEARSYMLASFLLLLSFLAVVKIVQDGRTAKWSTVAAHFAYVVATTLALYSHNASIIFLLTISMLVFLLLFYLNQKQKLLLWTIINLVVVLLWLPWLPIILQQRQDAIAISWIEQPSIFFAVYSWARLYSERYIESFGTWGQIAIPFPLLIVLGLGHIVRSRALNWLPVAAIALGWPAILWLLGSFGASIWIERVLVPSIPFGLLLMAFALKCIGRHFIRNLILALTLTVQVINLVAYYYNTQKPRWDELVGIIAQEKADDSAFVVVGDFVHGAFGYYADRHQLPKNDFVVPQFSNLPDAFPDLRALRRDYANVEITDLQESLVAYEEVWTIVRNPGNSMPGWKAVETLGAMRKLCRTISFDDKLRLYQFRVVCSGPNLDQD